MEQRVQAAAPDLLDQQLDRLEQQFGHLFGRFRQHVRNYAAEIDPALQPAGYRTLTTLAMLGPTNQSVLAAALGFDKSVMSRQLHQLEELGLVVRQVDTEDRRASVVDVTEAAHAHLREGRLTARSAFRRGLAGWDPNDLDELTRLLAKLETVYRD
jgi:DNA-binding MarR family transcriptional regulator